MKSNITTKTSFNLTHIKPISCDTNIFHHPYKSPVLINIITSENETTNLRINNHDILCTACILGEHIPANYIYECTSNFSTRIRSRRQATLQRCE